MVLQKCCKKVVTHLYSTFNSKFLFNESSAKAFKASFLSSSSIGKRHKASAYSLAYGLSLLKADGSEARRDDGTICKLIRYLLKKSYKILGKKNKNKRMSKQNL